MALPARRVPPGPRVVHALGPISRIAPVSVLVQLRSTLEAADPRELFRISHDERLRLADIFRTWAWAAEHADCVARAEAMLPTTLDRLGAGSPRRGVPRPAVRKTHCKRGHLLIDDNVYFRSDSSHRYCKACRNIRQRETRRQLRARRKSEPLQLEAAQ